MTIKIKKGSSKKKGVCLLEADSDFTIYNASQNHQELAEAFSEYSNFSIDLSGVEEMDCSGVQLLLAFKNSAEKASRTMEISSVSDAAAEVMNVLNIKDQFNWATEQ
ncbi:MAG: STAS domain-containing protein [Gammaproteobacteria bacterium]|nr:STAS domain-containing protein [Gammaproteobacteria bacterium]